MHPTSVSGVLAIEAYLKSWECRLKESNRPIDVAHDEIRVFKSNSHTFTSNGIAVDELIVAQLLGG
jgi:hypothetical protein